MIFRSWRSTRKSRSGKVMLLVWRFDTILSLLLLLIL